MVSANKIGIKQAPLDKRFTARCVVRDVCLKYTTQGKPYLELEVGDFSGRLKARLWEKFEKWQQRLVPGTILELECTPYIFQDRRELKIHAITMVKATTGEEYLEFLPRYPGNMEHLIETFEHYLNTIDHSVWQSLLERAFSNDAVRRRFYQVPAGKLWHHVYLGGLLHHVVGMLQLAESLVALYPDMDDQLLKTGIIFHDIGKLWCFEYSRGFIDYNTEGRLIGHVVLGSVYLTRLMAELPDFPREYRTALLHLVISHPGQHADGAPVLPQTREAIALWLLNDMDKKMNAVDRILHSDVDPRRGWSKFSPLLNRFLFQGFGFQHTPAPDSENPSTD